MTHTSLGGTVPIYVRRRLDDPARWRIAAFEIAGQNPAKNVTIDGMDLAVEATGFCAPFSALRKACNDANRPEKTGEFPNPDKVFSVAFESSLRLPTPPVFAYRLQIRRSHNHGRPHIYSEGNIHA
jgi:hypothetical protein